MEGSCDDTDDRHADTASGRELLLLLPAWIVAALNTAPAALLLCNTCSSCNSASKHLTRSCKHDSHEGGDRKTKQRVSRCGSNDEHVHMTGGCDSTSELNTI